MYTVYLIDEKIEHAEFHSLENAHKYCSEGGYLFMIIFEGMDIDDAFENKVTEPVAMYINKKRYDMSKNKN